LIIDKELRDTSSWNTALWWDTKITPIIAVPCLIWIALLEGEGQSVGDAPVNECLRDSFSANNTSVGTNMHITVQNDFDFNNSKSQIYAAK
jgi:hypothetical protein